MVKDKKKIGMKQWASVEKNSRKLTTFLKKIPRNFGTKIRLKMYKIFQVEEEKEVVTAIGQMLCIRVDPLKEMMVILVIEDQKLIMKVADLIDRLEIKKKDDLTMAIVKEILTEMKADHILMINQEETLIEMIN
jgi:hypothetical protein